jgi:hypothetical protein
MQETNSFINPLAYVPKATALSVLFLKKNNIIKTRLEQRKKKFFFLIILFMKEGSSETTREAPIVLIIKHLGEDIVRPGRKLLL